MEIITVLLFINLNLALGVMAGIRVFKKKMKPAIAPAKSGVPTHRLVKTYISDDGSDPWIEGWRFLCSCGAKGTASNTVQKTYGVGGKLGSEASAIAKFKIHRDNYLEINGNDETVHEDTIKLKKLEEEFAQWRKACYCKDTNDDLLLLKHRHLDSKPSTKVK